MPPPRSPADAPSTSVGPWTARDTVDRPFSSPEARNPCLSPLGGQFSYESPGHRYTIVTEKRFEQREAVELPDRIVSRIEKRLPRTEFDSAAEYVTFVMEEVLYRVEQETDDDFEPVAEAEVRDRLESLGYLQE